MSPIQHQHNYCIINYKSCCITKANNFDVLLCTHLKDKKFNGKKDLCYTFFIEDAYGRKNYDLETLHWLLAYNGY